MSIAAELDARHGRRARRRKLRAGTLRAIARVVMAAVLLALATLLTFAYLPRYQEDGRPILDNADFRDGFRGWQIEGLVTLDESELGHAVLQNRDPAQAVYLRRSIGLPAGRSYLRLGADIATSRVTRGAEPWQTARVYLVQQTGEGEQLWNQANELISLIGTTSRQHYETVFEVPGTIPDAALGIELAYATGRMEIADLELALVDERPTFRLAATLLICAWIVAFFPILSNTTLGLNSADHNLVDLFQLYGASRWQTIRAVVLPNSISGILTGVILQVSRAAGETAPVMFTGAVFYKSVERGNLFPYALTDQCMALSMHLYTLATQVPNVKESLPYATAVVLLGSVLHRYLSRHVSMNSFVQTTIATLARGDVKTWAPHPGARAVL